MTSLFGTSEPKSPFLELLRRSLGPISVSLLSWTRVSLSPICPPPDQSSGLPWSALGKTDPGSAANYGCHRDNCGKNSLVSFMRLFSAYTR